ncbi:MAG: hypothetical protein ACHBNF_17280 [Chromatiales bacterium]
MHEGFDPEGQRLPIKIDTTSNGEFLPRPLNWLAWAANREAHRYVGDCAATTPESPRVSQICLRAAATLLCLNQVLARAGKGGGRIVAVGTPETLATDPFLHRVAGLPIRSSGVFSRVDQATTASP